MPAQFRREVVANIPHVLEDENNGIDGVVSRTVVVIGVGEMLEQCQEISNALSL